jgi:uncharacterized protein (DUF934 family)
MSYLIKLNTQTAPIVRPLPPLAFKPAPAANPKPDLALVNSGQGDGRPKIKPNVPWAAEPTITHWEGGQFVRLQDWLNRHEDPKLSTADGVGVILMSHEDPLLLEGHLEGVGLIGIEFSRFSDGRGNSLANILRTRLGWRKEIRAVGDVLIDQIFFMSRCGFDAFALREDQNVARALAALADFPAVYQANADGRAFALQGLAGNRVGGDISVAA